MPRSSYIYIIVADKTNILGAYTVKWECQNSVWKVLMFDNFAEVSVHRFKDGVSKTTPTIIAAGDFLK